jgi:flavin-binding protein dodecin
MSKTVKGIKSIYVNDQSATVGSDGDVEMFRVNMQVTFQVND